MLRMSFYNGTLDRELAKATIKESAKPCKYTYGFTFKNPTTCMVPVNTEEAFEIIDSQSLLDIDEYEDYIHLNAFSANDMF